MTRHFVLGNKNILVGLDNHGRIRDFYYPYVGQENHVNGKIHRFGIWVDGKFSWLEDPTWQKKLSYQNETLITHVLARNDDVGLEIELCSGITPNHGIFLRHVRITNLWDSTREIRLFFHQQFDVSEGNIGDTVYYNPLCKSIIHYKGKRYFLMNGSMQNGDKRKGNTGIAEYATGLVGEYGREGTWRDAEDGVLSNNPVEHGSVDSTVAFHGSIAPRKTTEMHYWICVADSYKSVSELHEHVLKETPATLLEEIGKYWRTWVNKTKFKFPKLRPEVVDLFKRSLLIINTHVDKRGAIIASSDSEMLHLRKDTYSYMWPRDGALIARSLDRAGYSDITEPFFAFCNTALSDDGYLFHKYRPDGSLGSSWHSWVKQGHIQLPIQEDESALVVYALWKHFELHGDQEYIEPFLESLIRPIAEFMVSFIDEKTGLPKETYDLWEEKLGIHTFTCGTVYAGLIAAANFERLIGDSKRETRYRAAAESIKKAVLTHLFDDELGYFIKMVYYDGDELKRDTTVDLSSTYAMFEFGFLEPDDEKVQRSMEVCMRRLQIKTPIGGYARYENDYYYRRDQEGTPGNPWFITTLWVAEWYIALAKSENDLQPAIEIFNWVASHALETGVLPEQLDPHTGEPVSVAPLTWSHAAFVIAINKYLERLHELGICEMCNPPQLRKIS